MELSAGPGSLRSSIPYLSGAVDQAKVRLGNWKQKGDVSRQEAERLAELERQDREMNKQERSGRFSTFLQVLAGLAALVAFIYLLVRMPRKGGSPTLVLQLLQSWLETDEP